KGVHRVHRRARRAPRRSGTDCTDRLVYIRAHSERERGRMAVVDRRWSALPVPHAVELPDRLPKERYFDPDFYQMEAELLWPRVWQMACRLEEIPHPRDFAEYEILDQSIVVVRSDDG